MAQRIALAGGVAAAVGALVVVVVGGVNANGAPGPALTVLAGALAAVAATTARRGDRRLVAWLAIGVAIVAVVDAVPVARYSADLDTFGGLLGGLARLLMVGGAVVLVVGSVVGVSFARLFDREGVLVVTAAALLSIGWLALITVGVGFAPRLVDGLAIIAIFLAVGLIAIRNSANVSERQLVMLAVVGLAGAAAIITLSSLLSVDGRVGALVDSGATNVAAFVVYLASVIPIGAVIVLVVRPLLARPITAAATQLPPPPPPPPPPAPRS